MRSRMRSYLKQYPVIAKPLMSVRNELRNRWMALRNDLRDFGDTYLLGSMKAQVTPYGFKLVGSHSMHHKGMQEGLFEPEETEVVQHHLRKADVFIDVGANIGFYSCIARSAGKYVVAIEPLIQNLHYLYANLTLNGWTDVEVYPMGLSDRPGLATLYGASGTGASLIGSWAGASQIVRRTIPLSTLDILLDDRFSGKKLIIKIDVEGVERQVLLGSRAMIDMSPRPTWLLEVCLNEYHPTGLNPDYAATFDMFWQRGYEVRTADRRNQMIRPADVEKWIKAGRCDSGVINYIFVPPN